MAIGLQLAGFWLFAHGVATGVAHFIPRIELIPIVDNPIPPAKPPEPHITTKVKAPVVAQPEFTTEESSKGNGGITATLSQPNESGSTGPRENVVRAAVGILSTHTVPPYPPIAQRIGAEGKVTLRLTVSADGRVTEADVESSSGRDELDQTARQWILAHWAYKPALENGVPVVSHVLATVTFSLATER
ncbi:MAG TPA: energy transducer TonB [Rhizomicrobium sp.]